MKKKTALKNISYSIRSNSWWDSYFKVTGGPFNREKTMGVHITDENGFTLAVSPSVEFAEFCERSILLFNLLKKMDASYHIGDLRDQGYLDGLKQEDWDKLKELLP